MPLEMAETEMFLFRCCDWLGKITLIRGVCFPFPPAVPEKWIKIICDIFSSFLPRRSCIFFFSHEGSMEKKKNETKIKFRFAPSFHHSTWVRCQLDELFLLSLWFSLLEVNMRWMQRDSRHKMPEVGLRKRTFNLTKGDYICTYVSFFVHNMGNQFLIFVENGLNIIIRFFIKSLTEKMEYFSYPLKNHHSTEISTVY